MIKHISRVQNIKGEGQLREPQPRGAFPSEEEAKFDVIFYVRTRAKLGKMLAK